VAPEAIRTRFARVALAVLAIVVTAVPAHALRLVNYNIMFYPSVNVSGRNPYFRQVMGPLGADIVIVQELGSAAGVDSFRTNVLNVIEPGMWSSYPYTGGPDSNNGCFYKTSKVTPLGSWFWLPPDNLRHVNVYRFRPVGYTAIPEFRIYSLHLKAGNTSMDENRRLTDAISIRDSMNNVPPGTHCILTGDFNSYKSSDLAVQKFLESQTDNDGRLYDPKNAIGTWQDNPSFASIHTQCPSTTSYRPSGSYSGGGVDDRFDLFLPTYNMNDGQGLDLLANTYIPVGNDGLHINLSVTDPPIAPADTAYARALWWSSDHLPIRVDLQLPAKLATAPPVLAFGNVIVGAAVSQNLAITNPAVLPADALDYSLAAPAGFSAPGGSFAQAAGAAPTNQTIGMSTASSGVKGGTLDVTSDDPDHAVSGVALSGTVLEHADASLDSLVALASGTLDFGTQAQGGFTPLLARVHDRGYNALRARLAVSAATISGGDGRFTITGGFSPVTVAGTAATFEVQYDDTGATPDSTCQATLTFTSADEPLPGGQPQPDLTVLLSAHPAAGVTATEIVVPTALRFYAPRPNPMSNESWIGFDLPRAAPVALEIFDLAGRRVATLASGERGAGHYEARWAGTNADGSRVKAGLYFVRFATPGLSRVERIVRLP
jgi:hypothetical protein